MAKFNKHLDHFKDEHALSGEEVVAWVKAFRDERGFEGVAILTNQRVVFIRRGMMSTKLEPWPLASLHSVESRKGLLFLDITLHSSGDKMELRIADKELGSQFLQQLQSARNASAEPSADAGQPADPVEQLEKLAKLRDAGAVTAEEFESKKAELLKRI